MIAKAWAGKLFLFGVVKNPVGCRGSGLFPFRSGAIVSFDQGAEPHELNIAPVGANMAYKKEVFEEYDRLLLPGQSGSRSHGR